MNGVLFVVAQLSVGIETEVHIVSHVREDGGESPFQFLSDGHLLGFIQSLCQFVLQLRHQFHLTGNLVVFSTVGEVFIDAGGEGCQHANRPNELSHGPLIEGTFNGSSLDMLPL